MQIDQTTFESKTTKQKLDLFGIIRLGVFLFFGMALFFFWFIHGFHGKLFDGFPKECKFYAGYGEFIVGKATVGEMLDQTVPLELTSSEKNTILAPGGRYNCSMKAHNFNFVSMDVKNLTGKPAPLTDCTVMRVNVSGTEDVEKYIHFDFPIMNSEWCLKHSVGSPNFIWPLGYSELWMYSAEWTGEAAYTVEIENHKVVGIDAYIQE